MIKRNQINSNVSNTTHLEQTGFFLIARLNSQIAVYDDLLSKADALEKIKSELLHEEKRAAIIEEEIDQQHFEHIDTISKTLVEAQEYLEHTESNVQNLRIIHKQLNERCEALKLGRLLREDLDYVTSAIEKKSLPHKVLILKAEEHLVNTQNQIDWLLDSIQSDEAELQSLQTDLALFAQGKIPEQYLKPIEVAQKNAATNQDTKIRELTGKRELLTKQCSNLDLEIKRLEGKIRELAANDRELRQVSSKGIFNRLGSSAWWGSFTADYTKEAQGVSQKKTHHLQELSDHKRQLSSATSLLSAATSERSKVIEAAEAAERKRQHELCQSNASLLPQKIQDSKSQLLDLSSLLASTQKEIAGIKDAMKLFRDQIAEESRQDLLRQAQEALDQSFSNLNAADSEVDCAKARVNENTLSLDQLQESLVAEKTAAVEKLNAQLDGLRKAVFATEEALLQEVKKLGIEASPSGIRQSINERRSELISELEEQQGGLKLNEESYDQENSEGNSTMSFDQLNAMGQESVQATGNIYFDFSKNEDDNQDASGRTYPGLRSQIVELRRSLGKELFPDSSDNDDLLSIFVDTFFPEGITQAYYICNLSVRADQP